MAVLIGTRAHALGPEPGLMITPGRPAVPMHVCTILRPMHGGQMNLASGSAFPELSGTIAWCAYINLTGIKIYYSI